MGMMIRSLPGLALLGIICSAWGQETARTFTGSDSSDGRSRMTLTLHGTKVSGDSSFDYPKTPNAIFDLGFGWRSHYEGILDPSTGNITGTRTSRLTSGGKLLDEPPQACAFTASLEGETIKGNWTLQTKQGAKAGSFVVRNAAVPATGTSGLRVTEAAAALAVQAGDAPVGYCALHVQRALEAGGIDGKGHPEKAGAYGAYLKNRGFVGLTAEGYKPQKGDIVVVQPGAGVGKDGHIAMYDGSRWISDFRETTRWETAEAKGGSRQFFRP